MNYKIIVNNIIAILLSLSFVFSNCPNGEDICLSLDGSSLNYDSSADIAGFQFGHAGCATGASGGDAEANGFTVTGSGTVVLGFSFTGSVIPAGAGTLVDLGSSDCTESTLTDFIVIIYYYQLLNISYQIILNINIPILSLISLIKKKIYLKRRYIPNMIVYVIDVNILR